MKLKDLFGRDLLGRLDEGLYDLFEMAIGRAEFKKKLSGRIEGAFREYVCNRIAVLIREPPEWEVEIDKLSNKIKEIISSSIIKGIFKNSEKIKNKAVIEVLQEISLESAFVVREAKDKVISKRYYPTKTRQIDFLDIDADAEFQRFVEIYLPERFHNFNDEL